MNEVKFTCPSCKQPLESPPDLAGQLIDCPACNKSIEVPQKKSAATGFAQKASKPKGAVQSCPACQGMISNRATQCPHCGHPIKKKSRAGVVIFLAVAIIVTFAIALSSSDSGSKKKKSYRTLKVDVSSGIELVTIKNTGSPEASGKTIDVYVNGQPPFTFKSSCKMPAVGGSVTVPLRTFIKKDGSRFNPDTHAVTELWVGGGGYDYTPFGK